MTSLANPGAGYKIIEYDKSRVQGVSVWNNDEKAQALSDSINNAKQKLDLQGEADRSFGKGTVSLVDKPKGPVHQSEPLIQYNNDKFNKLFKGDIYGTISEFEKQVLKNDFPEDFMNGKGYWEGLLHIFVKEGIKPEYGFGDSAGNYQGEFMNSEIGKLIERDLVTYYNNKVRLKHEKGVKKYFNNAIDKIVNDIPKYWRMKKAQSVDLGGGSNKITTRKYKNRKLSYRRHNKKRTTKNRRRYSRRK